MPYEDERAGLAAIRAIAQSGIVNEFRDLLVDRHSGSLPPMPPFAPYYADGKTRTHILAIDGSNIYEPIPGSLPCTEAGLVSLGVVVISIEKLMTLKPLPDSGAANPRELRSTENGETLGTMLPGQNAAKQDGTTPRTWFRQIINTELEKANLGGESFSDTLNALLTENRAIRCPDPDCGQRGIEVPGPGRTTACPTCQGPVWLSDGLRIHEQFVENEQVGECHARFRDALEILALVNALRHLVKTATGRTAIANTAFVMDGPLAAFGTIAVLAQAVRKELQRIQRLLNEDSPESQLLVMSGIKSGPFVEHAAEIDRAPEPNKRIPPNHVWLPDNDYIRSNIVAGASEESTPWGMLTYFGRPVILKTAGGQRLVLNLAQPEAEPPLTDTSRPLVLDDALATAGPLGVGAHQFLPLRRVHAQAAIPLRVGTDLIRTLAQ